MLSDKLKKQTKEAHLTLEKKLVAQIKAIQSVSDYARVLRYFYIFFGGLEVLVSKVSTVTFLPDYHLRRKSVALANDLNALQSLLPRVAGQSALPGVKNKLEAAGAIYVMEGSTLGGVHIAEMIRKRLAANNVNAFSFFDGYGDRTTAMWQSFQKAINDLANSEEEERRIINAANDTFMQFDNLLNGLRGKLS